MKRLISADTSEILGFTPAELKQSIRASEGRVVLSENITVLIPQVTDITNAEIARAFGADLILLNFLDVDHPYIHGLDETGDPVRRLRELVGRPVGINLEPVDTAAAMHEERQDVAPGRRRASSTGRPWRTTSPRVPTSSSSPPSAPSQASPWTNSSTSSAQSTPAAAS